MPKPKHEHRLMVAVLAFLAGAAALGFTVEAGRLMEESKCLRTAHAILSHHDEAKP